jgi:oxygen-dependent protoporphyrinogen oxidase
MIGSLDKSTREVTVVGAGIAGMLASYYLDQSGYQVTLIEEQKRAGGLIRTRFTDHGIAESAAHSLIATETVLELCRDLDVELVEPRKEAKAKYIVRNGRLSKLPLSIPELITAATRATLVRSVSDNGQTLESWGRHHLGQPAVDYLMTPFVRGIYGVQPAQLGVAAAYPGLRVPVGRTLVGTLWNKRRRRNGNEVKKRVAPKLGMGHLVTQLERHLESRLGQRFRKAEQVRNLPDAPNTIIATPAHAAARLVEPKSETLAQRLLTVRYTPIVSVTVFVERRSFTRPVEGVGVLMPACEERRCLGILFNSSSFENRVTEDTLASFTVMMGGTSNDSWLSADDNQIEEAVREELDSLLGIQDTLSLVIHRWPAALPQYSPDLPNVWQHAHETWCATPGRVLFGNYTGQISLRGMIESAAALSLESSRLP